MSEAHDNALASYKRLRREIYVQNLDVILDNKPSNVSKRALIAGALSLSGGKLFPAMSLAIAQDAYRSTEIFPRYHLAYCLIAYRDQYPLVDADLSWFCSDYYGAFPTCFSPVTIAKLEELSKLNRRLYRQEG